jgi:hypothetical protein
MPSTDQRRIPLAEAFRLATGKEPPPPMTDKQQREFEAKLRAVREEARKIYGDPDAGRAA